MKSLAEYGPPAVFGQLVNKGDNRFGLQSCRRDNLIAAKMAALLADKWRHIFLRRRGIHGLIEGQGIRHLFPYLSGH
jgi:hypothetical protein